MKKLYILAFAAALVLPLQAYAGVNELKVVDLIMQAAVGNSPYNAQTGSFNISAKETTTVNKKTTTSSGKVTLSFNAKSDKTNDIYQAEGKIIINDADTKTITTMPFNLIVAESPVSSIASASVPPQVYLFVYPEYIAFLNTYMGATQLNQYANTWVKIDSSKLPSSAVNSSNNSSVNTNSTKTNKAILAPWLNFNWFTAKVKNQGASKVYTVTLNPVQFAANINNTLALTGEAKLTAEEQAQLKKFITNMRMTLVETKGTLTSYSLAGNFSDTNTKIAGRKVVSTVDVTFNTNLYSNAVLPTIPARFTNIDLNALVNSSRSSMYQAPPLPGAYNTPSSSTPVYSAPKDLSSLQYSVPAGFIETSRTSGLIELRNNSVPKVSGGFGYDSIRVEGVFKPNQFYLTSQFNTSKESFESYFKRNFSGHNGYNFQVKTYNNNMFISYDVKQQLSSTLITYRIVHMLKKNYTSDDVVYSMEIISDGEINNYAVDSFLQSIVIR